MVFVADVAAAADERDMLGLARVQERLLVTFDGDFGELIWRRGVPPPPAVPHLRLHPIQGADAAARVQQALTFPWDGQFVVCSRPGLRRRSLPSRTDGGPPCHRVHGRACTADRGCVQALPSAPGVRARRRVTRASTPPGCAAIHAVRPAPAKRRSATVGSPGHRGSPRSPRAGAGPATAARRSPRPRRAKLRLVWPLDVPIGVGRRRAGRPPIRPRRRAAAAPRAAPRPRRTPPPRPRRRDASGRGR